MIMAVAALPGTAHAQIEIVYRLGGEAHVITGTQYGRPVYSQNGSVVPAAGRGQWEIRPIESFAAPLGTLEVYYHFQPWLRFSQIQRAGKVEVYYALSFRPEETTKDLYCVAAWEMDGQVVEISVRAFPDVQAGRTESLWGQMAIKTSDRRGFLRAYLLQGGKSLRAVGKRDLEFASFRAALDRGDVAAATAWMRDMGSDRALPQFLFEQITRAGNAELLDLALTGAGAKHAKRDDGKSNLLAAAETGREECVALLLRRGADPNAFDDQHGSALSRAVRAESPAVVQTLLAGGADPKHFAWNDYSEPMRVAFDTGNVQIIKLLLDQGLKMPDGINATGYFTRAVEKGQIELASLLLERVQKRDALLQEPVLLAAALNADVPMLELLVTAGAKLDATGRKGENAIMGAAYAGDQESIAILQEAGASLTARDKSNRTAAAWALMARRGALAVKLAKEAPLSGLAASRLLHDAVLVRNGELVTLLLAQNATLDLAADDCDDVLAEIIRTGNLPVLTRALSRGLDVNRTCYGDWNLAGLAQRHRQAQVTAILETQAGHTLIARLPPVAKLPLDVFKRDPGLAPADFGEESHNGEAQVDVYVDAEGVPRVPMVRSASNEKIGHAALANILGWRFNRLAEKSKPWRRVIVPISFSVADLGHERAFGSWEVDEYPVFKPKASELPDQQDKNPEITSAAWMRFTVSASGTVVSPQVLSATTPNSEEQALGMVRTWEFYPAKINHNEVAFEEQGVVLLPAGLFVQPNTWIYLGKEKIEPEHIAGYKSFKPDKDLDAELRRTIILLKFMVDRRGIPKQVTVLGTQDSKYAKKAVQMCLELRFKPVVIKGAETEYPLTLVLAYGNGAE